MEYVVKRPQMIHHKTPVYFLFHGVGSNNLDLIDLLEPDQDKVILVSVQGNLNYGQGYAYYIPDFSVNSEAEVIHEAVKTLRHQIKEIISREGLEAHPIFLLGFSQGAILSEALIATYPNEFSGAVILNARLLAFLNPYVTDIKHDLLIVQGSQDPLFPIPAGQNIKDYFEASGQHPELAVFDVGHGINQQGVMKIRAWVNTHQ